MLKTVIYKSKLPGSQHFKSLVFGVFFLKTLKISSINFVELASSVQSNTNKN